MRFDYSVNVCSAAVADFDGVAVEYFVKFAQGWEAFVNELEE